LNKKIKKKKKKKKGFSEETIEYKNVSFTFIDVPPSSMVRQFRSHCK